MPRDVDERKTRKALRKLRAAKARAEAGTGPELSDWEEDFLNSLEARLEQYGSAFNDPEKGDREEPLSMLQAMKVKEIDKKTRGKGGSGFGRRNGFEKRKPRPKTPESASEIEPPEAPTEVAAERPQLKVIAEAVGSDLKPDMSETTETRERRSFKVIDGGRK